MTDLIRVTVKPAGCMTSKGALYTLFVHVHDTEQQMDRAHEDMGRDLAGQRGYRVKVMKLSLGVGVAERSW